MKALAPVVLALLFALDSAAQTNIPPRLLVRTICAGEHCENVNHFAPQIAPALTPHVDEGTLMVGDEDPIAGCTERLDRSRTVEVANCAKRKLFGLKAGTALRETEHDGYLLVILKEERHGLIQGHAVVLTPSGQAVDADLLLSAVSPDGMGSYQAGIAPPDATLVIDLTSLAERAANGGMPGLPPRREVIATAGPGGTARIWGSSLIVPKSATPPAP
jgi:hypothetical protein